MRTEEQNKKRDQELYLLPEGDPLFSPAHNKAVIDKTIKEYEAFRRRRENEAKDKVMERADAIATYWKHIARGGHNNTEKYFGKRILANLRGDEIRQELMDRLDFYAKKNGS